MGIYEKLHILVGQNQRKSFIKWVDLGKKYSLTASQLNAYKEKAKRLERNCAEFRADLIRPLDGIRISGYYEVMEMDGLSEVEILAQVLYQLTYLSNPNIKIDNLRFGVCNSDYIVQAFYLYIYVLSTYEGMENVGHIVKALIQARWPKAFHLVMYKPFLHYLHKFAAVSSIEVSDILDVLRSADGDKITLKEFNAAWLKALRNLEPRDLYDKLEELDPVSLEIFQQGGFKRDQYQQYVDNFDRLIHYPELKKRQLTNLELI